MSDVVNRHAKDLCDLAAGLTSDRRRKCYEAVTEIESLSERLAERVERARRFYNADGSFELLENHHVVEARRIEYARRLVDTNAELTAATERIGTLTEACNAHKREVERQTKRADDAEAARAGADHTISVCSRHQTPDPDCPLCNVDTSTTRDGATHPLAEALRDVDGAEGEK